MLTLIAFTAVASLTATREAPVETPYKQRANLAIRSVSPASTKIPQYGMVDLKVDLKASYDNPFDPQDVSLDAQVTPPSGDGFSIPGFLYRPYRRSLADKEEQLATSGAPEWRVRFSPKLEGEYKLVLSAKDRSGTVKSETVTITATGAEKQGFVKVSEDDPRYFAFDSGVSYWPVGANICWGDTRGTHAYDLWLPKYADNGVNYTRVWLSPGWSTFGMEQKGKAAEGKGMGQFDLANAWRLDYVLELARTRDIQLMLLIESYNVLRSESDGYPYWLETPQNMDNGGPLRIPVDFWTNEKMDRLFKNKLRYLVARYGAYSNTFSWEFWNEVDLTTEFEVERVRDWHKRMGQYLRSIDPYKHLITTSAASTMGFRPIDQLTEIDYIQTHHYGFDPALTTIEQQSRKGGSKPHYISEIGSDAASARREDDPKGFQIHDPMWASVATGSSGTAMGWWWDSLIAPNELYPIFKPVADFVRNVEWPDERFKQTTPTFAYQTPPNPMPMKDVTIAGGPVEWAASPNNRPLTVTLSAGVLNGAKQVAGILHGKGSHPDLHNPVTFRVNLDRPTRFDVEVENVSGYGGANLRIAIDGKEVFAKDFIDPDGETKTDTLTNFAGRYGVTIPKGQHTMVVSNTGADWVTVGYRFVGLLPRKSPPLQGWAVVGNTKVLSWIRLEGRNWRAAIGGKQIPAPPSAMALTGLASGDWQAEVWDTWEGKVIQSSKIAVPVSGKIRVNLPEIKGDVAVKLVKL